MSKSARVAPSPRFPQPYSPRRPSPLGLPPMGFPPLAPHMAFQSSPYPVTPDRFIQPKGPSEARVAFPADTRRPLAGAQRRRSQPVPPALNLNTQHHPPTQLNYPGTSQPAAQQEMTSHRSPPSPTPSDTSSLSLYSGDNATKNFPVEVVNKKQEEEEEKPPGLFCGCINFKALFGSKSKQSKILAPPAPLPAPAPQMVQTRRRPTPLNL